jgi:hypothetical protein
LTASGGTIRLRNAFRGLLQGAPAISCIGVSEEQNAQPLHATSEPQRTGMRAYILSSGGYHLPVPRKRASHRNSGR